MFTKYTGPSTTLVQFRLDNLYTSTFYLNSLQQFISISYTIVGWIFYCLHRSIYVIMNTLGIANSKSVRISDIRTLLLIYEHFWGHRCILNWLDIIIFWKQGNLKIIVINDSNRIANWNQSICKFNRCPN